MRRRNPGLHRRGGADPGEKRSQRDTVSERRERSERRTKKKTTKSAHLIQYKKVNSKWQTWRTHVCHIFHGKGENMKKAFAFILAAALTFGTAAAASADYAFVNVQNASAYLEQDGHEVRLTVDLSDGWSVEFAHAAAYLYDGPNDGVKEAIAMGLTLEKQVYDEYLSKKSKIINKIELEIFLCIKIHMRKWNGLKIII